MNKDAIDEFLRAVRDTDDVRLKTITVEITIELPDGDEVRRRAYNARLLEQGTVSWRDALREFRYHATKDVRLGREDDDAG